jgi:opacity protein-like surface antigen
LRTSRRNSSLWCCLFLFSFLSFASLFAETLTSGTPLEIRLLQPITSYSTPKGTKLTGVMISPVSDGGSILIPLGTTIEGEVVEVRKVGLGLAHETAEIELRFDKLVLADGHTVPIACKITQVENARESINKKGRIQGIRSTSTLSNKASGVVGSLAFGDPIAAIFATAGSASVLRFSEPEITLPAGTELLAELTAPIDLPEEEVKTVPPIASTDDARHELGELVRKLPFRTFTNGKKEVPSDLTNLAFIGSADALKRAFAAAGWVIVDTLTAESTYGTIRSVAENQGYKNAPMSVLVLDGREPDFAYAKTLNTFSKRHHLRIWTTTRNWQGQPVWTSSATHDIGIGFSKKNKTFIHLIDTNIDSERAKVVNDLIFTGCVTGAQLVARPWLPEHAKNGTGEDLITDGRIAVLQLDACQNPVDEAAGQQNATPHVHGNAAERGTRQTVLTLKNNILRDNVAVMAYSGIRYAIQSREKKEAAGPARQMDVDGDKYTISQTFHPDDAYTTLPSQRPPTSAPSSAPPIDRWKPPSVELGVRGGFHGYYGGNGGAVAYLFTDTAMDGNFLFLVLGNTLHDGWELGGTVTLNPWKYLSNEFSYDHSFTVVNFGLSVVGQDSTTPGLQQAIAFSPSGLRTSLASYNLLINARPKTSRLRPYLAVGPSLQLMHLSDAPIKKAPSWFKLGLSNIGLISAAYNFGSTPPLEGGGIFQVGFTYGGGVRYRITPRWMLRADFRETLTSQPDFWSKSVKSIDNGIVVDPGTVYEVIGPVLQGNSRQDRITGGVSFTF